MLPKRKPIRSKAIRQSADGETCTWPGCNAPAQCWAHSNLGADGKGKGLKAEDIYGAYLCDDHHGEYDGRTAAGWYKFTFEKQWHFDQAMKKSWKRLIELGIITVEP